MRANRLKQALQKGEVALGTLVKLSSPAVIEILGFVGFDFVIIDTEHGPLSAESTENLIRAAEVVGITPVVRVGQNSSLPILRNLDLGAGGIHVPQVETREEAMAAISASCYPPAGTRGVSFTGRGAHYGLADRETYLNHSKHGIVRIIAVETRRGIEALPEIVQVPGIDVIFIGPSDLSGSLGVPGQYDHPEVIIHYEKAITACRGTGIALGTFVRNPDEARWWIDRGFTYLAYSGDTSLLAEQGKAAVKAVRAISPRKVEMA